MQKRAPYKSGKRACLLIAMAFICGIFFLQASAAAEQPVSSDIIGAPIAGSNSPRAEDIHIVTFDPADGTAYEDFYKTYVLEGSTITDKPQDPKRDGYLFKGWCGFWDENDNPVPWDFATGIVEDNITLWAAWEEGCLVTFDPVNGTGYESFYKVTVPIGSTVSDRPEDPQRDGYVFMGWYGHLDANNEPELWNFATDVVDVNTMLWASWKKGSVVTFDPANGTEQGNFYRVIVPVGSLVTDRPENPQQTGYRFRGWYSSLDANNNPVFWNFATNVVEDDITLTAAWEHDNSTIVGRNDGERRLSGRVRNSETVTEKLNPTLADIEDEDTPLTGLKPNGKLPATGDDGAGVRRLLCVVSALGMIALAIPRKKKHTH